MRCAPPKFTLPLASVSSAPAAWTTNGIIIAKAMGADKVVGISWRASERDEVLSLRTEDYIATEDE